jgi:hypothetical protein
MPALARSGPVRVPGSDRTALFKAIKAFAPGLLDEAITSAHAPRRYQELFLGQATSAS